MCDICSGAILNQGKEGRYQGIIRGKDSLDMTDTLRRDERLKVIKLGISLEFELFPLFAVFVIVFLKRSLGLHLYTCNITFMSILMHCHHKN